METNNNLTLFNKVRKVPEDSRKKIKAGRLKGKTDISPMWRIEELTKHFGVCGIGWKTEIINKWTEEGSNGQKACFVEINLFIKNKDSWSDGITGIGGSSFIAKEKDGLYTSDECFKMAYTDAISVSCKMLGFGADIYYGKEDSKYPTTKNSSYHNDNNIITATQLLEAAQIKNVSEMQILKRYKDETGKVVDDIKFISQDKKKEYYNSLKEK